ncbi:MAG: hypothetical protein U0165_13190 [Polyangiaceae bacterium]
MSDERDDSVVRIGSGDVAALEQAVQAALDGVTLILEGGVFETSLHLRRTMRLVAAEGAEVAICSSSGATITIEASGCELEGLTVSTGGTAVIVLARQTHISRCRLSSHSAENPERIGAAIDVRGDDARLAGGL